MKLSLSQSTTEMCRSVKYGVCETKDGWGLFYIPYTGWGNTATVHVYASGRARNTRDCGDWQWGGTEDKYPDGEVFFTLEEATIYYEAMLGKPIEEKEKLQEMPVPAKEQWKYVGDVFFVGKFAPSVV